MFYVEFKAVARIIMPVPLDWSKQDVVLYHIRKLGEYISSLSRRPYHWDRLDQDTQTRWLQELQQDLTIYAEVMGRLTMALSLSHSTITDNHGIKPADALVDAILEAIQDVSQYLTISSDPPPKAYNPLLRDQAICLNCKYWNPTGDTIGTCQEDTVKGNINHTNHCIDTHGCSQFCSLSLAVDLKAIGE